MTARGGTAKDGKWAEAKAAIGWVLGSWLHPADRDSGWEQSVGTVPSTRQPSVRGETSHPEVTSKEKGAPRGGG